MQGKRKKSKQVHFVFLLPCIIFALHLIFVRLYDMSSMQLLPYKQQVSSLLRLGLPIVVGQLGMIILGLADTIMIGHHSTEELAAAAFVNNVFNLAIIFATGFSYGLTPLIGMLQGGGNTQGIGRVFRNALAANASVAVLLTAVMYTVYCFVDKLGQPEELLPHIRPYFVLQLISLLFIMLFNGFRQFAEGLKRIEYFRELFVDLRKFRIPRMGLVRGGCEYIGLAHCHAVGLYRGRCCCATV